MSFHTFRGQRSGKAGRAARQGWTSQASDRDIGRSFDQHGRPWTWVRDRTTGMPCGPYEPEGWSGPWMPDQGPATMVLNTENTTELFIDYRNVVRERVATLKEYHGRACKRAVKLGQSRPEVGDYSEEIVESEGEPPRNHQFAIACEQGNPWALGLSDAVDERLVPFLEGPLRALDETFESYDFSAESYYEQAPVANAIRNAKAATGEKRRYRSFSELRAEMKSGQTAADEARAFDEEMAKVAGQAEADSGATDGEVDEREYVIADEDGTDLLDSPDGPDSPDDPDRGTTPDPEAQGLDMGGELGYELDEEIEEHEDPEAQGGRTVAPQKLDFAARQAPRRPGSTAVPHKRASAASDLGRNPGVGSKPPAAVRRDLREFSREGRRTLADGARPVISGQDED